jgi:hypothetical protein
MKLSDIRRELLEQHHQIRTLMAGTRLVAEHVLSGAGTREALRGSLIGLANAVRAHNVREEDVLRDVIPSLDAWGPARAAMMTDEHAKEHTRLHAALLDMRSREDTSADSVLALVALMRDHMDREEAVFLREDLLRDDIVVVDQADG